MVHLELQHHVLQASASVEHPYGMEQLQAKWTGKEDNA
jgi:hypothetical protein